MTTIGQPGTEPPDVHASSTSQDALNRSILRLTWVNLCLLLVWYLLYSEHNGSQWSDDAREFSGLYKTFLLALVVVTLSVWGRLILLIWRRLQLGKPNDQTEQP